MTSGLSALLPVVYLLAGASLGVIATRAGGAAFDRHYPTILRTHMVTASVALSVIAAWKVPLTLAFAVPLLVLLLAECAWTFGTYLVLRRGRHRDQAAALVVSAIPNTGFWAVPAAGALAGPAGVLAAIVYDRFTVLPYAMLVRLMRRDAPIPQSRTTGWADQASLIALALGLALRITGPAPDWTSAVLTVAGPALGVTGGFVLGAALPKTYPTWANLRHTATLIGSRFAVMGVPVVAAVVVPLTVPAAVLAAAAVSATAAAPFQASGMAKMYGYRVEPVLASVPVGLIMAPLALAAIALLR